ncbi:collagen alpha-2(I) chain-like [Orcinus orca]|uniref:collagen alpha-2(I) chain-like n=1 Tax=Orcinus orca TaxID=9733 RepID=UPI00062B4D59|nr:collagen alpha-2(I) chain-like [Orcinus orca]
MLLCKILSKKPAPYCWAGPSSLAPRYKKPGFPGCSKTPLSLPPTTCPGPVGTTRRVRVPATGRPEAHFSHPGRGGRRTSEGGGWGLAPGTPAAPLAPGKGPGSNPGAAGGRGGRHSSFPLTQRQRSGRSPLLKGAGKLQQGDSGDPQKREVTEGWRKPDFACNSRDECARRHAQPARKRTRETGAARWPGARRTLAASRARGCTAGGRCRRQGGRRPARFPRLGSAEGEAAAGDRKRAAVAARARTASPSRAHTRTRCCRLPPPPAGFLPLRGPGCSGSLLRARLRCAPDQAPTRRPFPTQARRLPTRSPPPRPRPPLPPTPLQLLATPFRAPAAPAPGGRPRLRPRPSRPAPEPAPTGARVSAPLRWPRALRRRRSLCGPPSPAASRVELRPCEPFLLPGSPSAPSRGDALGCRAERSGFAPSGPARLLPACGRAGCRASSRPEAAGLGKIEDKFRLRSCVSKRSVLKQTPASFEPPAPQRSGRDGEDSDSRLAKAGRPCNSWPRQRGRGSGRKILATPRSAWG